MKIKAAIFFLLSFCIINLAFAEQQNHIINLRYNGLLNPQDCYAMGINEEDFADLNIIVNLGTIVNIGKGSPTILGIQGIDMPNIPHFTSMGLHDTFSYITGPHPIEIRVGVAGKSFILQFMTMQKLAQASRYEGRIHLEDNQRNACIIKTLQS